MLQAIVLVALFVQDPQAAGSARVKQTAFARIPLARTIASDAELRAAVDAKNATGETMNEIKRRDQEWIRNPKDPLRQELVSNACATRLRRLVAGDAIIVEAFLMDEHGALVCSTAETSDYWQGDEPKWQRTYDKGEAVFVDEPTYDDSSHTFAVQLSLPMSNHGRKTGALTLTLKVPREVATGK